RGSTRRSKRRHMHCATAWRRPRATPACRSAPSAWAACSACSSAPSGSTPMRRPWPATRPRSTASSTPCSSAACTWRHRPSRPGSCPARTTRRRSARRWTPRARPSGTWPVPAPADAGRGQAAASGRLFEEEYLPASEEGARYRWFRRIFHHDAPDERNFDLVLIATILASVVVVMLDSVPSVKARWHAWLYVAEWIFTLAFAVEYGARLWVVK